MGRTIQVIGIGPGNPEQVTVQAISAMNRAQVIFIPDKGAEKQELARVRNEICARYIEDPNYRTVVYEMPRRAPVSEEAGYQTVVKNWHDEIASIYDRLITQELDDGECGAFLVWGDPSLYDSVLRILDGVLASGRAAFDLEVVPGITSIQALAASHGIPLNGIGESILVTTGRRFSDGADGAAENVVVMLDGQHAYRDAPDDLEIFWGAYLGTEDEVLVSGPIDQVTGEIDRVRAEARDAHGWIMDTYLLRPRKSKD